MRLFGKSFVTITAVLCPKTGKFCRNPYNVTGICNRSSCPLANSRYATIRDHHGVLYLYMKTIERAHMPNKLWERVKLPRNYMKALEIIDKHLMYWPKYLVHKMKQRLTKMTQMRIRMRKLALKTREKIMTTPRKQTKREARRLEKAEKAALIDKKIEEELIERLKRGVYDDIYNYNQKAWDEVLKETETEEEPMVEYVEGYEDLLEEEEDDIEDFGRFAVNETLEDDSGEEDDEDAGVAYKKTSLRESKAASKMIDRDEPVSKSKKKAKVLVEVEHEGAREKEVATH